MFVTASFQPYQIDQYTYIKCENYKPLYGFPLLSIDRDSYIVKAQIQSNLDMDASGGRHCLAIGKACALADSITFMIDMNHDYGSVIQGEASFLKDVKTVWKSRRKGSIILQNDVWIGHGATIMAGVTLHNGCVVAADAVVTKDVPPYAIVGGNPAEVLRFRFNKAIIEGLQKIAWWDWPLHVQQARRKDFSLPPEQFVEKYLPEAEKKLAELMIVRPPRTHKHNTKTVLLIPDFSDPFPLWHRILEQYFAQGRPHVELILYLAEQERMQEDLQTVNKLLEKYEYQDTAVVLQTEKLESEEILFQCADYFITTRSRETVRWTCLAERYGVKVLYGTDEPIFPPDLQ